MPGIIAYGGYVPRLRLQRKSMAEANAWFNPGLAGYAKGERAICNWDEDAVTMAVEAERDALHRRSRDTLGTVILASTTAPFEDPQNSTITAQALGVAGRIETSDLAGSQRAGTTGLIVAADRVVARGGAALVIAAEKRRTAAGSLAELTSGDGAAAVLVAPGDGIARMVGSASSAVDFVDHYRGRGQDFDHRWEERWIRDEATSRSSPR